MKKFFMLIGVIVLIISCPGCGNDYKHIDAKRAAEMMQTETNYIILDVRTPAEFEKTHIPNAVLLPVDEIKAGKFSETLPDKNQVIMIYCQTGRRAEDAAAILVKAGYNKVYEFGGLVDWNGAVE